MSLLRSLGRLISNVNNLSFNQSSCKTIILNRIPVLCHNALLPPSNKIHVSSTRQDLMEFFDDPENWSKREVKVGRPWLVRELRLKSNSDLHKLWYVLLKERNMLMTMQHEFREKDLGLPNPERLDKVEISMENIEKVVRERDRAYFELETGETGERPVGEDINCFGLPYKYRMREHLIPKILNGRFLKENRLHNHTNDYGYLKYFHKMLNEKKRRVATKRKIEWFKVVCDLMKRFPNMDEEALKEQFPDVNIERARRCKRSRGHRENLY